VEPLSRLLGRVVRADAGEVPQDLDRGEEGNPVPVREAAALRDGRAEDTRRELLREPRLADPGGPVDGHELTRLLLERDAVHVVEDALFVLPADERRPEPPEHAVGARPNLVEAPRVHVFALALERERAEGAGSDSLLDEPV